jgi:DNA polymerase III alpha subunit (gram-positive type)
MQFFMRRRTRHYTVVDVETTGLDPDEARVIQLAAVRIRPDGDVVDSFSAIVRPECPEDYVHGAEEIHGITADQVAAGVPLHLALMRLRETMVGAVFTAHNAPFDVAFLRAEARRTGVKLNLDTAVDTLALSRMLDADRRHSHKLGAVCERYGVALERAHDALADATATAAVLPRLLEDLGVRRPGQVVALLAP